MHSLGVVGSVTGAGLLWIWSVGYSDGKVAAALVIYGLTLITTFVSSAFYHMTPWKSIRPILRRADHAAIYLKILELIRL